MWVQLLTVMQVEINGTAKHLRPGDWVEVGRQSAMRWIAEGRAISPKPINELIPSGAGVVLVGENETAHAQMGQMGLDVKLSTIPVLPFNRTLLIRGRVDLRTRLFPVGFNLLDRWQIVAPLLSYDTLAAHLGKEWDRERTKRVIRDLRVPVYDVRLLFVRKCADTQALLQCWQNECRDDAEPHLAFMRALYQIKPQLCALPTTWTDKKAGA